MSLDHATVLRELTIGQRVAEDEATTLAEYFVVTDQFQRLENGDIDIVFGAKGAGKSAMYSSLLARTDDLFDRGIVLISGENPRGGTAFSSIASEPPTSEVDFIALWKLYILTLLDELFRDWEISTPNALDIRNALVEAGLTTPKDRSGRLRRIRDYIASIRVTSVETNIALDPTTAIPLSFGGKISLGEPSSSDTAHGVISIDTLLRKADLSLNEADVEAWLLFDRLDVAFAENRELEANALRALFRAYNDLKSLDRVKIKIFLRTDIWKSISEGGFREASHITRSLTIEWSNSSLLNLAVLRLVKNTSLLQLLDTSSTAVLATANSQREFFNSLVPVQIDSGRNPKTFEWIIGRLQDASKTAAPRELIHLLTEARNKQLQMLERGELTPSGDPLFSRQSFRDALPEVSRVRLEQTLFAEYPDFKPYLLLLEREKAVQTPRSLARIWDLSESEALSFAYGLAEIGFWEIRGTNEDPNFWASLLYRPSLSMVQGRAE